MPTFLSYNTFWWKNLVIESGQSAGCNLYTSVLYRTKNNKEIKCSCDIGDAIILNRGVFHKVPIVKRNRNRMSLNIFF